MSAYLCADDTFDYIATAAQLYATRPIDPEQVANALRAENVRSVRARYGDSAKECDRPYTYRRVTEQIDPVYVLASLRCLTYQSCEASGYEDSTARALTVALRGVVLASLGLPEDHNERTIKGYDAAPWGWTRGHVPEPQPTPAEIEAKRNARWLSAAEVAKLVRAAIAKAHPGVKFSVRARNYAGGSSVDVSWTDGPSGRAVDRTVRLYERIGFDGMTDSTTSKGPFQLPGSDEWLRAGSYVSTYRTLTPEARAQVKAFNDRKFGPSDDRTYEPWREESYARATFDASGRLVALVTIK